MTDPASPITPEQMHALADKYTNRHQIVLPCPRDYEAANALRSAADQIERLTARCTQSEQDAVDAIAHRDEARRERLEIRNELLARAEKAEAKVAVLAATLKHVQAWLSDAKLDTWPYMENGDFYVDKDKQLAQIAKALAPTQDGKGDKP